ncbi:g5827 [Coccomyxa elongata]
MMRTWKVLAPTAVLAVSLFCLASGWQTAAPHEDTTVTRTTSTRVSMLRRAKQEGGSLDDQTPLLQAWEGFCRRKQECGRHPQPPTKAYLISLPVDAPKREYSLQLLRDLGLDVEVIDGIKSVQLGSLEEFTECLPAGSADDCQFGLTQSHVNVWKALAASEHGAAWVFEDDVVFHDDFLTLFPQYWAAVPPNYEYIAVGMIPRHFNLSKEAVYVAPEAMPWGTHAYIIASRQAERMALTAEMMVSRARHPIDDFHTTSWQLDGEDIKIDHYLSVYYSDLTPKDDKRRWVVFDSPAEQPFRYGGVSWARNGGCQCSCADMAACAAEGRAPAWGMGLVAQHTCREQVDRVPVWHQEMAKLEGEGTVQHCSELRACGSFVCEYETLYTDDGEPMEVEEVEEQQSESKDQEAD